MLIIIVIDRKVHVPFKGLDMVYISILIQLLLSKADVMEEVLQKDHISEDGVFRDYCDGSFVRSHPMFQSSHETLLLSLYFDELEVANPLGSKRGKHKLGIII